MRLAQLPAAILSSCFIITLAILAPALSPFAFPFCTSVPDISSALHAFAVLSSGFYVPGLYLLQQHKCMNAQI